MTIEMLMRNNEIPIQFKQKFSTRLKKRYGDDYLTKLDTLQDIIQNDINIERCHLFQLNDYLHNKHNDLQPQDFYKIRESLKKQKLIIKQHQTLMHYQNDDYFHKSNKSLVDKTIQEYLSCVDFNNNYLNINQELVNIKSVVTQIGICRDELVQLISEKKIIALKKKQTYYFSKKEIQRIEDYIDNYISIIDIAHNLALDLKSLWSFNRKQDRDQFHTFLIDHLYFGLNLNMYSDMLFLRNRKRQTFEKYLYDRFIKRNEMNFFAQNIEFFLETYKRSNHEILEIIRKKFFVRNIETRKAYEKYLAHHFPENEVTPSIVNVYYLIATTEKEIKNMDNQEIDTCFLKLKTNDEKQLFTKLINEIKDKHYTDYNYYKLNIINRRSINNTAYSLQQIELIANAVFNEKELKNNNVVEKALTKSIICETWLHISCYFVCGWRQSDIIDSWQYLDDDNVCPNELREKIEKSLFSDTELIAAADTLINKIATNPTYPKKTGSVAKSTLNITLTQSLKLHFGFIMMIMLYHFKSNCRGKLSQSSVGTYTNFRNLTTIFGKDMENALIFQNLSTRRLNKSFLQGIESVSRMMGVNSFTSYMIAGLARNHKLSLKPNQATNIYLKDGSFTNESIDVISLEITERGVLGFVPYMLLNFSYDNQFRLMTARNQTQFIQSINLTPLELNLLFQQKNQLEKIISNYTERAEIIISKEISSSLILKSKKRIEEIKYDNIIDSGKAIISLHQIGNGFGMAKEEGFYCLLRAINIACDTPSNHTCIDCKYSIITKVGLPSLMLRFKDFAQLYKRTGNVKYQQILKQIVEPEINDLANYLYFQMDETGQTYFRKLIFEARRKINNEL